MFTSEKWAMSKWAKEAKGKGATEIILMPSFWNHVVYILDGSSRESSSACRQ
jgi:hypothetical protein